MNRSRTYLYQTICLVALSVILMPTFIVFAQKPRGGQTTAASKSGSGAPKCSGAWTGTIIYSRTQEQSDNKRTERVSGRGYDTRNWEMRYKYNARVAVIESPEKNGSSVGRATINHAFSSNEKIDAVEKNSCDQGKTWRDMRGTSTSRSEASASEGGVDANVSIGVNDNGTYAVSVGLPQIKGKLSGEQSSTFGGQCKPKEGKTLNMPPTETTIDGNSLTSDGTNRINPSDPNKLSGTYSRTWQNVTETITWNLQKCGTPLRLTDLRFEDMKFPNWNDWQEVVEQKGTIDGNLVKIKATVLNASGETKYADLKFKETFKGDKWDGARPDGLLTGGEVSVRLDAGEEKEVEMVWDSSGYAWFDDGRPRYMQRVKAELEENGKRSDEMTKNLKVAPKPLVLVHGLWSSWKAWEPWQNILTTSHSYDWKAFPVGEKPEKGVMNTGGAFMSQDPTNGIFENSQQLGKYIRYAQEDRNAWHVDIVAHSMGGLISRHYIHTFMPNEMPDGRPQVSHLVMLGTPNMGSPCADVMDIVFSASGATPEAIRQLKPAVVEQFNRVTSNRKGVKFSVLAGDPLPVMCKTLVANDGVVPVPSAIWKIKDNAISKNLHTDLTGTADFSSFVKPRLAIGPNGDHGPATPDISQYPNQIGQVAGRNYGAMFLNFAGEEPMLIGMAPFVRNLRLTAKQSIEIDVPVNVGANLGVTFMAVPTVSVILVDDSGAVVGKNLAGSAESRGWFRSIYYDKQTNRSNWRLRIENTSDLEHKVALAVWDIVAR